MAKRVIIDEHECEGSEICVELCPEVFGFDRYTKVAKVISPHAEDEHIKDAIDSCPAECIYWVEE